MSAQVICYSASEWDTSLSLKVECLPCSIEWGWSVDGPGRLDLLQGMADKHNAECHD